MANEFHEFFPAVVTHILAGMGRPPVKQPQARRMLPAFENEQTVIPFRVRAPQFAIAHIGNVKDAPLVGRRIARHDKGRGTFQGHIGPECVSIPGLGYETFLKDERTRDQTVLRPRHRIGSVK